MNAPRYLRTSAALFVLTGLMIPDVQVSPDVGHHIFVVDRSGSMCGDIDKLKQAIEQVIAVDSYVTDTLTTLISFSSQGDVTLHWEKVASSEVMKLDNPYIKVLRAIRATYLTGISQALDLALTKVSPNQTTGITLFTDGYANDPSASQEIKSLDSFTARAALVPGVFLNCVGYRDWCDWPRMNAMSNALSGKTVKATSFREVLDAMRDTQALLANGVTPAINFFNEGHDLLVAINRSKGQVNGTYNDMSLRGVAASDDLAVYSVVREEGRKRPPADVRAVPTEEAYLFGALALAYIANSELRIAKELLFESGNKTLWEEHQSAMTPSSLAALVQDLQAWVVKGTNDGYEMGKNTRPKYNLSQLADALGSLPPRSVGLVTTEFYTDYRRRSIKSLPGTRELDGTITPPRAKLVPRGPDRTYVYGMSFNGTDASIQLKTFRDVSVQRASDGKVMDEVNFVSLRDISDYKTPTMISCGERNVEEIPLEVYSKEAWNILREFLIPSKAREEFFPGKKLKLQLKRFGVDSAEEVGPDNLLAAVGLRNESTAHVKFLSAAINKVEASPYTPDQAAALSELHLTPALYFSAPSHVHYADREEAIRNGDIDSFTRYRVLFGTIDIFSAADFSSGNAFLKARYTVTSSDGVVDGKPTLASYLQGASYVAKPPKNPLKGADAQLQEVFNTYFTESPRLSNAQLAERLSSHQKVLDRAQTFFRDLVMEIGCTGLIPKNLERFMTRYEPDALVEAFPNVKLGKNEKEGIFFVSPNGLVISVIPETSWYTVKFESDGADEE